MNSDFPHMTKTSSYMKERASHAPKILLTDTNRWPVTARLAIAFLKMGGNVAVLCPAPGHPAAKVRGIGPVFEYSGLRPLASLRRAIEAFTPDIVVPSCDRGVQHLHELHAVGRSEGGQGDELANVIEYSLGSPEFFTVVSSRRQLLETARSEGILVPETRGLECVADLSNWNSKALPPWVLKADGTWGGRGVRIAHTTKESEAEFRELTRAGNLVGLLKRVVLNRDRGWNLCDWKRPRPAVIAQSFIQGRPANCAVVCREGKILAGIAVEVILTQGSTGPSTVVQIVEGSEMMLAAERIARRLKLSGFLGFDFIIEDQTGKTFLIEMNPRCTPPCPLSLGKGQDLVAALWAELANQPLSESEPLTAMSRIAYFPQAVSGSRDVPDALLDTCYVDLPLGAPDLMQELLHPWPERSIAGQVVDFVRQKRGLRQKSSICLFQGALSAVSAEGADGEGRMLDDRRANAFSGPC